MPKPNKRRRRTCDAPTPRQSLPADLLLEIAARVDVVTLLRCAATSKPLRRDILDPAFVRRLASAHGGPFDPALLLGFSYWFEAAGYAFNSRFYSTHVVEIPPSPVPRVSIHPSTSSLLAWLEPIAARDGLVVLRHRSSRDLLGAVLCVFDALTGEITCLPPAGVKVSYPPALLTVRGDRSFELLVANGNLKIQTLSFRSKSCQWWGPVRAVAGSPGLLPLRGHAVVLGRAVHWLSVVRYDSVFRCVVSLDVDAAVATMVQLPLDYRDGHGCYMPELNFLLAVVGGRLSLLAVDDLLKISVWTLTASTAAPAWSRDLLIDTLQMERLQGGLHLDFLRIEGFGERSGAVVLQMGGGELIRLDLGTKKVTTLCKETGRQAYHVCLHEIDLASLFQAMKIF